MTNLFNKFGNWIKNNKEITALIIVVLTFYLFYINKYPVQTPVATQGVLDTLIVTTGNTVTSIVSTASILVISVLAILALFLLAIILFAPGFALLMGTGLLILGVLFSPAGVGVPVAAIGLAVDILALARYVMRKSQ